MAFASIGNELPPLSQKLGLTADLAVLDRAWHQEIGGMGTQARIAALDHAALVVEVNSSAVMQEISLRRRELVRKLNKHLPVPFIQHIHVRVANEW